MNFETKKKEFFERLGETCYMVLATSHKDYPMASTMTCLVFDNAIWMQTDKKFDKYNQLLNNPQVALVKNATQIEGVVEELDFVDSYAENSFTVCCKDGHCI